MSGRLASAIPSVRTPSNLRGVLAPVLSAVLLAPLGVGADGSVSMNWPHWRGPLGNGVVERGDPPVEWGEDKNVKWKVTIPGRGHATPVIWGDRVYVLTAVLVGGAAVGEPAAVGGGGGGAGGGAGGWRWARPGGGGGCSHRGVCVYDDVFGSGDGSHVVGGRFAT